MLIADWITLSPEVARSLFVTYILIEAFWPLTIFLAVAGFVWWRNRKTWWARIVAGVAVVCWTISAAPYFYYVGGEMLNSAQQRARQETLRDTKVIAGIQLPAGTVVTHPSASARNEIETLELQQEASVYGIPLTGQVNFDGGRPDGFVTLARDAEIGRVPCSAKGQVQLKRGTLDSCTLSRPAQVRGIPCQDDLSLSNDGVECTLAWDYQRFGVTWRAGTGVNFTQNDGTLDIMARPPNLYVLGLPLPNRAIVYFAKGRLASMNFTTLAPWRVHGCSIGSIDVRYSAVTEPRDRCGFPRDRFGNVVLSSTAFTIR